MPEYKLTYFDITALGETIRWAFKVAGVPFEDERIPRDEWNATAKKSGRFPTEQIPLLEIDGKVYSQSGAILRYLAKQFGLVTGDPETDLRVDQADQLVSFDGFNGFARWVREQDEKLKEVYLRWFVDYALPLYLKQVTDILESSGGDYIAGSKLTYADLSVANWFEIWTRVLVPDLPQKFPRLAKHNELIFNLPPIREWVAKRPKTFV